jgi:lysophospholipase L1-like esterase
MAQLPGIGRIEAPGAIMLTVGGNDLLRGLSADRGSGMLEFERKLRNFIARLPGLPLFIGNVYDPTFGDDSRNFLGVEAAVARRNHLRVNEVLRNAVPDGGRLVDLHSHFLKGDASWFTHTIEPSLTGASEVRRAFLPHVLQASR